MKIVLLGGNGQVGGELRRALEPLGTLCAPTRQQVDLFDQAHLQTFLQDTSPDVLVNAAAYTDVDGAESEPKLAAAINAEAVAVMARTMSGRGLLVHYSTDYVFDGKKTAPYTETDQTNPLGVYGKSKRDGEIAIAEAGGSHIILRTSWVYAARGRNFIRTMLRLAAERSELRVVADQTGAPTSAEFIADVTAVILQRYDGQHEQSGIYHICPAGKTNWHAFACLVLSEALSAGAILRCTPDRICQISSRDYATKAARPVNSQLDTAKLIRTFGVELPDWQLHVRRTVRKLMENR